MLVSVIKDNIEEKKGKIMLRIETSTPRSGPKQLSSPEQAPSSREECVIWAQQVISCTLCPSAENAKNLNKLSLVAIEPDPAHAAAAAQIKELCSGNRVFTKKTTIQKLAFRIVGSAQKKYPLAGPTSPESRDLAPELHISTNTKK